MSAGPFQKRFYTSNDGKVRAIKIQPETTSLTISGQTNTGPSGPADPGTSRVRVSGGRRSLGLRARKLYVRFTDEEDMPAGYKFGSTLAIPVLQPSLYENSLEPPDQEGTYLGHGIVVLGGSPEGGRR